jgi:hypothetical protein
MAALLLTDVGECNEGIEALTGAPGEHVQIRHGSRFS